MSNEDTIDKCYSVTMKNAESRDRLSADLCLKIVDFINGKSPAVKSEDEHALNMVIQLVMDVIASLPISIECFYSPENKAILFPRKKCAFEFELMQ